MTTQDDFEKATREVFHKIHLSHLDDACIAERHTRLIDLDLMGLPADCLKGLKCADLGCGSAVHGTVNLLQLGAGYVHAMDLDDSIVEPATQRLNLYEAFSNRWQLDCGSLMELPYPDEHFEFVLCANVIHHTSHPEKAVKEIFRVLAPGAKAYLSVTGKGGLLNRLFKEILREEYLSNPELQQIVQNDQLEIWLRTQLETLKLTIENDNTDSYEAAISLLDSLDKLIDTDLALSLTDVVEAPTYRAFTQSEWFSILESTGFKDYYRFGRKLQYNNVRKIFAPLYFDYNNPLARLLYHDGAMNVVVSK